ncbi:MAG TPA: threonine synthase [Dehalococcoidia bacterium]|nr:threonine synthase [Dehalococcoidia bacterium]
MTTFVGLRCRGCGQRYPNQPLHVCAECFGPLEADYDYEAIRRRVSRRSIAAGPPTFWRYRDFLPVGEGPVVDLQTGLTPLHRADRLARALGLRHLYLKNDCVNPTYSFKDRVVGVAATKAIEFGFDTLACASTGNLACSVAAHAARAGLKAIVFIPAGLESGKVLGAAIYDPLIVAVEGTYDDVNRLCSELADEYPWAFVNINLRPYYGEGSKTLGFEVVEQLGWRAPDQVIAPIASGSLFTKIYKGINEFARTGLIDAPVRTRMFGAQALGCSPVATALASGSDTVVPVRPETIAKSLAIGNPADGRNALDLIRGSGGSAATATDDEIVEGIHLLARTEGIFAETAGGVTIAALQKLAAAGAIDPDGVTVAYLTGNGLKTQEAVAGTVRPVRTIRPTVTAFGEAIQEREPVAVGSIPRAEVGVAPRR